MYKYGRQCGWKSLRLSYYKFIKEKEINRAISSISLLGSDSAYFRIL